MSIIRKGRNVALSNFTFRGLHTLDRFLKIKKKKEKEEGGGGGLIIKG